MKPIAPRTKEQMVKSLTLAYIYILNGEMVQEDYDFYYKLLNDNLSVEDIEKAHNHWLVCADQIIDIYEKLIVMATSHK